MDGEGKDNVCLGCRYFHNGCIFAIRGDDKGKCEYPRTRVSGKAAESRTTFKVRVSCDFDCTEDGWSGDGHTYLRAIRQEIYKTGFEEKGVVEDERQKV